MIHFDQTHPCFSPLTPPVVSPLLLLPNFVYSFSKSTEPIYCCLTMCGFGASIGVQAAYQWSYEKKVDSPFPRIHWQLSARSKGFVCSSSVQPGNSVDLTFTQVLGMQSQPLYDPIMSEKQIFFIAPFEFIFYSSSCFHLSWFFLLNLPWQATLHLILLYSQPPLYIHMPAKNDIPIFYLFLNK